MEKEVLGFDISQLEQEGRYLSGKEDLERYSSSLNGSKVYPRGVAFPIHKSEVVELVKYANHTSIELFAISKGKNWGYGTAQGSKEGQIIVDFSKMNKILEIEPNLCTMTLQPGVTQFQAYDYIESQREYNHLQLDITGAGKESSVVGNMLERGFGHTDYGDRYQRIITMEVVLGDGTVINTGFGAYKNANATRTYRYGVGPILDGIFTQSNFGIITEMTIELMPKPEKFGMFLCMANKKSDIVLMVEGLRKLRLDGIVNSTVHIANKSRTVGQNENKFAGTWTMGGAISGPKALVKGKKKAVRKVLKAAIPGCKVVFVGDGLLQMLHRVNKMKTLGFYKDLKYVVDLQKGIPTNEPIHILMDKEVAVDHRIEPKDFPLYMKWIPAVCRADKESVLKVLDVLESTFAAYDYEFRITMTAINARTLTLISNISYEKDEASVEKAGRFYNEVMEKLVENGFYPYRSGSGMFDVFRNRTKTVQKVLDNLKKTLDPNLVLANGKYGI